MHGRGEFGGKPECTDRKKGVKKAAEKRETAEGSRESTKKGRGHGGEFVAKMEKAGKKKPPQQRRVKKGLLLVCSKKSL